MELKDYQENAVIELLNKSKKFLLSEYKKIIVFQAPTGSGKTIMMAEVLKRLCEIKNLEEKLSFVWTAPLKLHEQSKKKLSNYYKDTRDLNCSYFEDLQNREICFNEILFFNWSSINKEDNIYIRENERSDNLSSVLERTRTERKIVLIIDESHYGVESPAATKTIEDIKPNLTFRVSATPLKEDCPLVRVDIDDVKRDGMIKQGIILNDGFENNTNGKNIFSDKKLSGKEAVLREAIYKRGCLQTLYRKGGLNINPLLLIQFPSKKQEMSDGVEETIKILGRDHGISKENGKLGIWLSQDKENVEEIDRTDSPVEVLIFKQAIALGWDCPRSHVLVLFRDLASPSFTIQTLGRIMRVAEIREGIYSQEFNELNYAYVFTNLPSITLDDELAKTYTTIYDDSIRKDTYSPLVLSSWYRVRQRERTRLSRLFREIFKENSKKYDLENKIDVNKRDVERIAISQTEFSKPRDFKDIEGEKVTAGDNEPELEDIFNVFLSKVLIEEPFYYPEECSIGNLKMAIYDFFSNNLKIDYEENYKVLAQIVLNEENNAILKDFVKKVKESYEEQVKRREPKLKSSLWEVPESIKYNQYYKKRSVKKSIMDPFYEKIEASPLEKKFIEYLDKNQKVEWWFKNGEKDISFFAVPYEKDGREKLFYVDFLVKFHDGKLGFFDTKGIDGHGGVRESEEKFKALRKYLNTKSIFLGGAVVWKSGIWQIYDERGQDYDVDNDKNWKPLIF